MKVKNLLLAVSCGVFAFSLNSCKKSSAADEFETTFELSGNHAVTENLTTDANDVLNEVAIDNNVMGGHTPSGTIGILGCATVTVTPLLGFPKNILIDFGPTNCLSPNGRYHRGKINIVLSDSLRKPGSTAVMTFNNYYVNDYKKEGTITWTNTSIPPVVSWQRSCVNGKITAPDGRFWLHNGTRDVTMTAGSSTPNNTLDDVFSILGTHTVTNAAGASRTWTVLTALQKKTICANVDKGTARVQGPNHYAIIDFGDGTCDNIATISIDGRTPRTIILH